MSNKKILIYCISMIIILSIILLIDYTNIGYFISKNLNYNFLNIIVNAIIVIFIFILTYCMVEKKTFLLDEKKEKNKLSVLKILLENVYESCKKNIELVNNQNTLEKYIIPKINMNSLDNLVENRLKNIPFINEQYIIDLFKDGICEDEIIKKYFEVKQTYQEYISLRITFFDLEKEKNNIPKNKYLLAKSTIEADKLKLEELLKKTI